MNDMLDSADTEPFDFRPLSGADGMEPVRSEDARVLSELVAKRRIRRIVDKLRTRWRSLLDSNDADVVAEAMGLVPESETRSGWFIAIQGWLALSSGNSDRGIPLLQMAYFNSAGLTRHRIAFDLIVACHDGDRDVPIGVGNERISDPAAAAMMVAATSLLDAGAGGPRIDRIEGAIRDARQCGDTGALAAVLLVRARAALRTGDRSSAIASAQEAARVAADSSLSRLEIEATRLVMTAAETSDRALQDECAERISAITSRSRSGAAFVDSLVRRCKAAVERGSWDQARVLAAELAEPNLVMPDTQRCAVLMLSIFRSMVQVDAAQLDRDLQRMSRTASHSARLLMRALAIATHPRAEQSERNRDLDLLRKDLRKYASERRNYVEVLHLIWALGHTIMVLHSLGRKREVQRDAATLRKLAAVIDDPELVLISACFAQISDDGNSRRARILLRRRGYGGYADYLAKVMPKNDSPRLSHQQRKCLSLLDYGRSRKEIADALGITIGTVGNHLDKAYKKLGGRSHGACTKARAYGLIYDDETVLQLDRAVHNRIAVPNTREGTSRSEPRGVRAARETNRPG